MISIAITSIFYVRVTRQQAAARPKVKRVLGAAAVLAPGTPITADNVVEIPWPEAVPLEGAIEKREDVVGHVLAYSVGANEPILKRDIASSTSFGLAAKIPDGMRATAVKTNEVNNMAGFLFPGCRVDVLVTLRGEGATNFTRTVLQNVEVLSTGAKIEADPQGKPENVNVITLLVTPEDSEKLALAENQGSIQFVLRNGGDSAKPNTLPVDMAELSGNPKKLVQPEAVRPNNRKTAIKAPQKTYDVETVAGGKTTVAKFNTPPQ